MHPQSIASAHTHSFSAYQIYAFKTPFYLHTYTTNQKQAPVYNGTRSTKMHENLQAPLSVQSTTAFAFVDPKRPSRMAQDTKIPFLPVI
jgi:hypothetical protein